MQGAENAGNKTSTASPPVSLFRRRAAAVTHARGLSLIDTGCILTYAIDTFSSTAFDDVIISSSPRAICCSCGEATIFRVRVSNDDSIAAYDFHFISARNIIGGGSVTKFLLSLAARSFAYF